MAAPPPAQPERATATDSLRVLLALAPLPRALPDLPSAAPDLRRPSHCAALSSAICICGCPEWGLVERCK
eukprot:7239409-Prymnesium_polylepis.1